MARAIAGDEHASSQVVDCALPVVLGWCLRLCGGADPEDAAHDVLVVVLERLSGLRQPEAFPAWLFQITRKICASRRRRHRVWGSLFGQASPQASPAQLTERQRKARRVQAILDQLTPAHREVLVLHDVEGRSDSEVARLLDIPKGTVKSRLRNGRKAFRERAARAGLVHEEVA